MITRLSHYSIYVLDQDQAYDFYVNKLGFEVVTDATMDNGFRWLTVRPKDQKDTEIVLNECFSENKGNQVYTNVLLTLFERTDL